MKNFICGLVLGLAMIPVYQKGTEIVDQIKYEYSHRMHTAKFQVGDCIRSYYNFDGVIYKVLDRRDYGVLIGLKCPVSRWWDCSMSAYDIIITDENSTKIKCPEWKQ